MRFSLKLTMGIQILNLVFVTPLFAIGTKDLAGGIPVVVGIMDDPIDFDHHPELRDHLDLEQFEKDPDLRRLLEINQQELKKYEAQYKASPDYPIAEYAFLEDSSKIDEATKSMGFFERLVYGLEIYFRLMQFEMKTQSTKASLDLAKGYHHGTISAGCITNEAYPKTAILNTRNNLEVLPSHFFTEENRVDPILREYIKTWPSLPNKDEKVNEAKERIKQQNLKTDEELAKAIGSIVLEWRSEYIRSVWNLYPKSDLGLANLLQNNPVHNLPGRSPRIKTRAPIDSTTVAAETQKLSENIRGQRADIKVVPMSKKFFLNDLQRYAFDRQRLTEANKILTECARDFNIILNPNENADLVKKNLLARLNVCRDHIRKIVSDNIHTVPEIAERLKYANEVISRSSMKVMNLSLDAPDQMPYLRSQFKQSLPQAIKKDPEVLNGIDHFVDAIYDIQPGIYLVRQLIHQNPGTIFVIAAGNEGIDLDKTEIRVLLASNPENCIVVGSAFEDSIDPLKMKMAEFSNRGASSLTVAAFGDRMSILKSGGGVGGFQGTSLSTNRVSNVLARFVAQNPNASSKEIIEKFLRDATVQSEDLKASVKDGRYLLH